MVGAQTRTRAGAHSAGYKSADLRVLEQVVGAYYSDLENESGELLPRCSLTEPSGANDQKTSAQEDQGRWLGNTWRGSPTSDLVIRNLVVPTGAGRIENPKPDGFANIASRWRETERVLCPITCGRS